MTHDYDCNQRNKKKKKNKRNRNRQQNLSTMGTFGGSVGGGGASLNVGGQSHNYQNMAINLDDSRPPPSPPKPTRIQKPRITIWYSGCDLMTDLIDKCKADVNAQVLPELQLQKNFANHEKKGIYKTDEELVTIFCIFVYLCCVSVFVSVLFFFVCFCGFIHFLYIIFWVGLLYLGC